MNGTATFGDQLLAAAVRFAAHNPHYVREKDRLPCQAAAF
jgi:hypothetical protein